MFLYPQVSIGKASGRIVFDAISLLLPFISPPTKDHWHTEAYFGNLRNADANAKPLAMIMKLNTGLFQGREYCRADDRDWLAVAFLKPL